MRITADFAGVPIGVGLSYDSYRKFFEAQQTEAAPAASVIVGEADPRRRILSRGIDRCLY